MPATEALSFANITLFQGQIKILNHATHTCDEYHFIPPRVLPQINKTVDEAIAQKEKLSYLLPLALKEKIIFNKKILKIYCPHILDGS